MSQVIEKISVHAYAKWLDVKDVLKRKDGDFVQQALLWTLIAIAGIGALTLMGGAISEKFTQLRDTFINTNP